MIRSAVARLAVALTLQAYVYGNLTEHETQQWDRLILIHAYVDASCSSLTRQLGYVQGPSAEHCHACSASPLLTSR